MTKEQFNKLKYGDQVVVTSNDSNHRFKIGELVYFNPLFFENDEGAEFSNGKKTWYLDHTEIEYEQTPQTNLPN